MEPHRGFPPAASAHDTFWDFRLADAGKHPHDHLGDVKPRTPRMIEGFGVNTFRLVDKGGKSTFVKFHWRLMFGMQSRAMLFVFAATL
jgi:catalase